MQSVTNKGIKILQTANPSLAFRRLCHFDRRVAHIYCISRRGFRLNALVSLLANASWGKLAAEFLAAKEDPAELQTFVNCILAQGWREAGA